MEFEGSVDILPMMPLLLWRGNTVTLQLKGVEEIY